MDRNDSQPLYLQIKQKLMERIQSGEFNDGDMLPTENILHEEYKVSRATIRNALDEIEKEQLIVRKRGVGTIIRKQKFKKELMKLNSFTKLMKSRGMKPSKETIKVEIVNTPKKVRELFKDQESKKTWLINRILKANDETIGLQYIYLPQSLTFSPDELLNMDSFYELMNEKHSIKPYYGEETLTAIAANEEKASILGIEVGDPLLNIWRTTYDESGFIFEVNHLFYIASSFEYYFKLYA